LLFPTGFDLARKWKTAQASIELDEEVPKGLLGLLGRDFLNGGL
jgi:hypothetical protein